MRQNRNVDRIFSSSFKQKARLTGRLLKSSNPKTFQFANLISSDCSEDDDSIPEEDEIRSYLQVVESGYLN